MPRHLSSILAASVFSILWLISSSVTATEMCDQMRSYGMSAYNAYEAGATKNELYDRAKAQAGGNEAISELLINVVYKALQGDSAGDAGRRAYRFCENLGM